MLIPMKFKLSNEECLRRFFEAIHKSDSGCWLWTGSIKPDGYGQLTFGSKSVGAHRLSYMVFIGDIPESLTIDHLCRIRNCVNPEHLEAVSMRENQLRGTSPMAHHARKTHCKRGHEFTPENTYARDPNGYGGRECKACWKVQNDRAKEYRAEYFKKNRDRIMAQRKAKKDAGI